MSRKGSAVKRNIKADPVYADKLVGSFINRLMRDGKKSVAERIVYQAFEMVGTKKGEEDSLKLFKQALENIKPLVEVRSRRVGGANYQVPMEVRAERKVSLGIRWMIDSARKRGEKTMARRLAAEILEALENKGGAIRKKEEVHRMAEANRAFAHYRW